MLSFPSALNLFVGPVDPRLPWTTATSGSQAYHCASFTVDRPVTVSQARFSIGNQSGNMALALFTDGATLLRIATTGSFSVPAAGVNTRAFTAATTLVPGIRYWVVVQFDNTSASIHTVNVPPAATTLEGNALLALRSANSQTYPPPASITRPSSTNVPTIIPVVCFS